MRIAIIYAFGVSCAFLLGTVRAASAVVDVRVDALAFGCDFTRAKTVDVLMLNIGRAVHVSATETENGGLRFSFTAPPGPIFVDYSVDGVGCAMGGGGLIVLPSHERHLLISMHEGLFVTDWHARKFVAGTLPSVPVGISVVTSASPSCPGDLVLGTSHPWGGSSSEIPAVIDGGAFYVDYVRGQHMFLKLTSGFDTLYLALPRRYSSRF
jgi:hypothetical protein